MNHDTIPSTSGMGKRRVLRRGRLPWEAIGLLSLVVLAWVAHGILMPVARHLLAPAEPSPYGALFPPLAEEIRHRLLEAFTVTWLFFLGASLGSFLNVVIYRCPRGKTLLGHSICPYCEHPIRAWHNIPVFGWLLLRGRCYDCRLPIAARYPIVEAICGGVFVLLAFVELFTGGVNLPTRPPIPYHGIAWIVFDPQWDLLAIYAYHCGLVTILLSWALIWYDEQRVPTAYIIAAYTIVILLPAFAPELRPSPAWVGETENLNGPKIVAVAIGDGLLGSLIGGLVGGVLLSQVRSGGPTRGAAMMGLAGAAFGWPAAFSIGLLIAPLAATQACLPRGRVAWAPIHWCLAVWAATLVQLLIWHWVGLVPNWPAAGATWFVFPIATVVATWLIAELERCHERRMEPSRAVELNGNPP